MTKQCVVTESASVSEIKSVSVIKSVSAGFVLAFPLICGCCPIKTKF